MTGPEVRWVDGSGKLAEVVFTPEEVERLKQGKPVAGYAPEHPVARWTYEEAVPHITARLRRIEREQDELSGP